VSLSAYEITLISGGFTLAGVLLGVWVGYYFSIRLINRQEFNKAAIDFRIAFIEEIRFIDHDYAIDRAGRDIPEVLAAAADSHETALIIFKDVFLSKTQRNEIEKAWKAYTGDDKITGKYTFRQYATHGKLKDSENIRKLALARIENILKFADPKKIWNGSI